MSEPTTTREQELEKEVLEQRGRAVILQRIIGEILRRHPQVKPTIDEFRRMIAEELEALAKTRRT